MNFMDITAAGSYWVLILMWSGILLFYAHRLRDPKVPNPLFNTLIWILAIDAFRTLFESFYFGGWYTSRAGILPQSVHDTLVRPELVLIPKVINIIAAALVIGILIRRWLPNEEVELHRHQQEIDRLEEHARELRSMNDSLQLEIAERRRMEQSLRRLFETQESERQLVAHEIHDGITQYATGAMMTAESLQADSRAEPLQGQLGVLVGLLQETVSEGRRLIAGLRPLILDEGGILQAVEHLISENDDSTMAIRFDHQGAFGNLSPALKNALYRITQESLTNAKKHSRSDRVEVTLTQQSGTVRLEVQDWGVGFQVEDIPEGRYGIRGLEERAQVMGGTAQILSTPGEGTRVIVELPVPSEARSEPAGSSGSWRPQLAD